MTDPAAQITVGQAEHRIALEAQDHRAASAWAGHVATLLELGSDPRAASWWALAEQAQDAGQLCRLCSDPGFVRCTRCSSFVCARHTAHRPEECPACEAAWIQELTLVGI